MEDIAEEPIVDIDSCDAKNPLAVVEYVEDLFAYYRKMEVNICLHMLFFDVAISIDVLNSCIDR